MNRRFLTFVLFLALHVAHGQDSTREEDPVVVDVEDVVNAADPSVHELVVPDELPVTRQYREQSLSVREFNREKWEAVVGGTNYDEEALPDEPARPFSMPWAGPVLKVVSYIVMIGLVIFLVYYITKNITFDLRVERNRLQTDDLEKPVENIDALDIEALLEQARREGNFRMAIRLYYLGLLKKLNAQGIIVWKKDKTNRDYLSELFMKNFRYPEIQRLTASYEAVWYGEHTLKGESLERMAKEFENVYRDLTTSSAP